MEEFSDFGQYWEKLEKEKKISGYGLVKVFNFRIIEG